MSHSTIYRICLLVIVILTIIGGIFYYVNHMENEVRVTKGTLVRAEDREIMPEENFAGMESEDMTWQGIQRPYI